MAHALTVEDLLAGAANTHTVQIPAALLGREEGKSAAGEVVLRPLVVRDVERIARAAKEQRILSSVLMVQQALVSPKLSVDQVADMAAGVVQFLVDQVNRISGLSLGEDELDVAVRAPLSKVCFVLAREFGWTPAQCAELTIGQVLLYLEMLGRAQPLEEGVA
jgi:hypothetical protein